MSDYGIPSNAAFWTGILVLVPWGSWYWWRFVLGPRWHSDEPEELPYLFPVLGHVLGFMKNAHALLSYGREYFQDKREPFTVTIMGESMYIVTSPEDVSTIYRMTTALDYNPFVKEILHSFGLTDATLDKMYDESFQNGKSYMDASHDSFKLQMHPGEKLESLQTALLGHVDRHMAWKQLNGRMILSSSRDEKFVSLYKWSQEVLTDATTRAFYDDCIYNEEIGPDLLDQFFVFEDESWKLPLQYPEFAAKKLYSSKLYCEEVMARYLKLPQEKRSKESWILRFMDDNMRLLGVEESQMAPTVFSFYRLVNTNAYKLSFWLLSFILCDSALLTSVRGEVELAFENDSLNLDRLLNQCSLLNSAYEEILRLANWPMGYRTVMTPCVVGGKRLRPGRKLLMPYRQMHYDPAVFGPDIEQFNPRRFLNKPALSKSKSWRPFGGAATHCPGRFLARRGVLMFIALALERFDLEVESKDGSFARVPKMDDSLPSGGIMTPMTGEDLMLKVLEPAERVQVKS